MTDPQVAIFMLSLFIFLVLLGFPIAFTLIAMGVGFGYYAYFESGQLLTNKIFYLSSHFFRQGYPKNFHAVFNDN